VPSDEAILFRALLSCRGLDADTNSLITLETMTCNVVHHSEDAKEGVKAFLEKRTPVWTGR